MSAINTEFEGFLQSWVTDELNLKPFCQKIYAHLQSFANLEFEYKARAGVTYSLRAKNSVAKSKRPVFVLVDIIDDEPDARWLSVCFYADMVNDADEIGDFVPKGLLGEDALCFNLDETDDNLLAYVLERISEAANKAGQ